MPNTERSLYAARAGRGFALFFPATARLVIDWMSYRRRIESDRPIMEQARKNFALASIENFKLPDPGARWGKYAKQTRAFMAQFKEASQAIRFAQTPLSGFETREATGLLGARAAAEEERLSREYARFSDSLSLWAESFYADPNTTAHYKGRPVSSALYLIMAYCLFCLDRLPTAPNVVCEIGGGYGGPARAWLTNPIHRPAQYIIVDLPESLFFSELYLVKHFGADRVVYVADRSAGMAKRIAGAQVVLCPNGYVDMLAPLAIDLAINTNSLQEMSEAYIDFFMGFLDGQNCRFFFSSNYALQDLRDLRESMNTWSPRMSPAWKTIHLAHYHDEARPTQTGLYEKSPHDLPARQAAASEEIGKLLSEPLERNRLARLLDLIRLSMNEAAISSLLRKMRDEYPFMPKEAWYLVKWLRDRGASDGEIKAIEKTLAPAAPIA